MTKKIGSKYQILSIPFLVVGTIIMLICYFLMDRLDFFVHGALYEYGLIFDYEWANWYWNYSALIRDSILISLVAIIFALIFVIIQIASKKNFIKPFSSSLIVVRIFFAFVCFFSLLQLDTIVNHSLYSYGLQFSYDWAIPYWNMLAIFFGLFLMVILIDTISMLLVVSSESWFYSSIKPILTINSLLFFVGIAILFLSVYFNSSILVFIGLGCVFWGVILINIKSSKYVKEDLLLTATPSLMKSLRKIILELGYAGEAIYLPPKYLNNSESSKVFISETEKNIMPLPYQIQRNDKIFIKNPKGLLITPPGYDLSILFEKTLNTTFTQKDLGFFERKLRKLIIEDLEIAQNIQLEKTENSVYIKIENSAYRNMGTLSSAIACVLAKITGNLVIIENRETNKNGKIVNLYYRLFESAEL